VFDGHASIQMLGAPTSLGNISFKDMAGRFISHILHSSTTTSDTHVKQVHV